MSTTPAIPTPAAVLPGEIDILANVLAALADDTAKLVYADWLEERGDPRGPLLRRFVSAFRGGTELPDVSAVSKPWTDLVGLTLLRHIHGMELASRADQLLALARPALTYKPERASEKSLAIGASRLGGRPDLPSNIEWPEFDERPLAFVGQFNLADLQFSPVANVLPAGGVLSLFCLYDEERQADDFGPESYRLFYFSEGTPLTRHEAHNWLREQERLPSYRLTFAETQTLPGLDSPWVNEIRSAISGCDEGGYVNLHFAMLPDYHFFGYPSLFQGINWGADDRHLLQLGDGYGWIDGDVMYFVISEDDLKRARFYQARLHVQVF